MHTKANLPRPKSWAVSFHGTYFLLALLLFGLEVFIAVFVHDAIIRPYGGDLLATILLYCLVRSLLNGPARPILVAVLLLSYLVEIGQYFGLLSHLGWQHSRLATVVLGSHFAWSDMLAYTLGAVLVLAIEYRINQRLSTPYSNS